MKGRKNLGNTQVSNGIGVPKKLAKTLKSIYERVYFLVKLNLYAESLQKTFKIEQQLFSRNIFQMAASDSDKTKISKCNVVSCLNWCS